jgi:hypothetical protein
MTIIHHFDLDLTWHIKRFMGISWEYMIDLDCHFILSHFLAFRKSAISGCLWLVEKSRKNRLSTTSQIVTEKVDGGDIIGDHPMGQVTWPFPTLSLAVDYASREMFVSKCHPPFQPVFRQSRDCTSNFTDYTWGLFPTDNGNSGV